MENKKWWGWRDSIFYVVVFVVSAIFFSLLQWTDSFADPDAFYHAKMAVLIVENRGPIMSFPWLPLTSLADTFIDHHFLYHLFLVPFVMLFPPFVGIKVAAVLFAAVFVTFFSWLLTRAFESLPQKYLWTSAFIGILLTNHIFVSRLNIPKTGPLVLILLFAALYSIQRGRIIFLGVVSFLWVWTHGSWPLVLIMAGLAWLTRAFSNAESSDIKEELRIKNYELRKGQKFLLLTSYFLLLCCAQLFQFQKIKLPLATALGCLAGLVINPYFPTNLSFYWLQTGKIALANIASATTAGNEWFSLGASLAPLNAGVLILFMCSLVYYAIHRHSSNASLSLVLAFLFLILSIRSQRYLEYFVPVAILFSAYALLPAIARLPSSKNEWSAALLAMREWRPINACLIIGGCYALLIISGFNIAHAYSIFRSARHFPVPEYRGASEWLTLNTPKGSRVYHDHWDDFPGLFFFNSHNTYISGLDPRFLAEKNQSLDRLFADLASGTIHAPAQKIVKDFGSEYVFTRKKRNTLADQLVKDKNTKKVYEDSAATIFYLIRRTEQ